MVKDFSLFFSEQTSILIYMSNERPRKVIDLSVLHLDTAPGLSYIPTKATDPEQIAIRRDWPTGTVVLASQYTGAAIAHEIASFPFTNRDARAHTFNILATMLVNSAWHSYPERSQSIMRSVVDLPELAVDTQGNNIDTPDWRETEAGSLEKIRRGLGFTANNAFRLFDMHRRDKTGNQYDIAARRFSRSAASTAMRMATIGLVSDTPGTRSAVDIQNDVRTIGLSLLDETRYAHELYGTHPTLAQLADDPRNAWLMGAPQQTRDAFDSAFARIDDR